MEKLTKEIVNSKKDKEPVEGFVLIRDYLKKPMKNGRTYLGGNLMCEGVFKFKVWPGELYNMMESGDFQDKVCAITGTINDYSGSKSIVIDSLQLTDVDPAEFLDKPYDINELKKTCTQILNNHLSAKGVKLFSTLSEKESGIFKRFYIEFAASNYHDNCINGVFAHSTKMLQITELSLNLYPSIQNYLDCGSPEDARDLLFLGVLLHDIGKTIEMHNGIYQPNSAVSHRFFGAEIIARHKEFISDLYSEKWYYDLISVLLQHHDEYGEPCKTVIAKIVSFIDAYESQMCILTQSMSNAVSEGTSGKSVYFDSAYLTL